MPEPLSIHAKKSALLVMDFQIVLLENFIAKSEAAAVLDHTAKLLAAARAVNMMVVYVMVAFRPGYPEISPRNELFTALKKTGMFTRENDGTRIHPAVAPKDEDAIVVKHRVSAFAGTDLEMLLKARGVETLVLAGITTGGVILSTVRQGFDLDYNLIVARDCCADHDEDVHNTLLDKIIAQHAMVMPAAAIEKVLRIED